MTETTEAGFAPGLATALAQHISHQAAGSSFLPTCVAQLLEAGYGVLFDSRDSEDTRVLVVYQDGQGTTCVRIGHLNATIVVEEKSTPGTKTLPQKDGDWVCIGATTLTLSSSYGVLPVRAIYILDEVTDVEVPAFVSGYVARLG